MPDDGALHRSKPEYAPLTCTRRSKPARIVVADSDDRRSGRVLASRPYAGRMEVSATAFTLGELLLLESAVNVSREQSIKSAERIAAQGVESRFKAGVGTNMDRVAALTNLQARLQEVIDLMWPDEDDFDGA